jgi:hypothetical protein
VHPVGGAAALEVAGGVHQRGQVGLGALRDADEAAGLLLAQDLADHAAVGAGQDRVGVLHRRAVAVHDRGPPPPITRSLGVQHLQEPVADVGDLGPEPPGLVQRQLNVAGAVDR